MMKRTGVHCPCGGEFVTDTLTVEAGGQTVTQATGEDHCERCGCALQEAAERAAVTA